MVLEAADGPIDIIGSCGDIGGQDCLMLNPELLRNLIRPHTASLVKPFKDMGWAPSTIPAGRYTTS
jgi:hypothetical protein